MSAHPYRLASARPVAPTPPRLRWPSWWLDVVGAAVTLLGLHVARRGLALARRRQLKGLGYPLGLGLPTERLDLSDLVALLKRAGAGPLDSHGAPCPANPDAMPRVETGEIEMPPAHDTKAWAVRLEGRLLAIQARSLDVPDVGAMVRAADAKWGPLVEAASEPPSIFVQQSPEFYRRVALEMANHLKQDDEARGSVRKGGD